MCEVALDKSHQVEVEEKRDKRQAESVCLPRCEQNLPYAEIYQSFVPRSACSRATAVASSTVRQSTSDHPNPGESQCIEIIPPQAHKHTPGPGDSPLLLGHGLGCQGNHPINAPRSKRYSRDSVTVTNIRAHQTHPNAHRDTPLPLPLSTARPTNSPTDPSEAETRWGNKTKEKPPLTISAVLWKNRHKLGRRVKSFFTRHRWRRRR